MLASKGQPHPYSYKDRQTEEAGAGDMATVTDYEIYENVVPYGNTAVPYGNTTVPKPQMESSYYLQEHEDVSNMGPGTSDFSNSAPTYPPPPEYQ